MTTKLYRISLMFFVLAAMFTFQACQKDDPQPEVNQEEFNRAVITFTKLDANGNETATTVTAEFDELAHDHSSGSGGHDHDHVHVHLEHGAKYRMAIGLYVDEKLINEEIMDEADLHQFFFLPSAPGIISYQYEDKDKNNKPVGLKGVLEVTADGEVELNVILRHNLNKNHAAAAAWNSVNHPEAGGADDLNINLEIHAGH